MRRPSRSLLLAALVAAAGGAHAAGWSAGTQVSPTGNPDPTRGAQTNTLAVNAAGVAVAAWDQYFYTNGGGSTIGAALQNKGRWEAPVTLSDPLAYCDRADSAVGGDGTIVVAWSCQDPVTAARSVQAAVRAAGSTKWSAPVQLASGYTRVSPDPSTVRVAMNAAGEAWVAWSIHDGAHYVVEAAWRPAGAGTSFAPALQVSPVGEDAIQPALALNDNGAAAIAWAGSPWNMGSSPNTITVAKSPGHGGAFGAGVQVAPLRSPYTGYQNAPSLCLDRGGLATVTWFGTGIQANWESAADTWNWTPQSAQDPQSVIVAANTVSSYITPSLACDRDGNAIAAAVIFDATVGVQRAQLWAATFDAAADAWSAQARLTGNNPRKTEDIAAASAALAPDASVAWIAYVDHYSGVVKAIHRGAAGWGAPYTIGKTSRVASFAEVVNGAAAANAQGRVLWKTQGGAVHMAADWKP